LGVLPPASARFLPKAYAKLMLEKTSPIADFYPEEFEIDMNGKKNAWEGVVLVQFIDESRLLAAEKKHIDPKTMLNEEERRRNTLGVAQVCV
jgi:5'-3' exonuclease